MEEDLKMIDNWRETRSANRKFKEATLWREHGVLAFAQRLLINKEVLSHIAWEYFAASSEIIAATIQTECQGTVGKLSLITFLMQICLHFLLAETAETALDFRLSSSQADGSIDGHKMLE